MVAERDAAVTRPEKSRALAPRLGNKKRTRKTTTEVPNISAQELDLDERLDRLESGVRKIAQGTVDDVRRSKKLESGYITIENQKGSPRRHPSTRAKPL